MWNLHIINIQDFDKKSIFITNNYKKNARQCKSNNKNHIEKVLSYNYKYGDMSTMTKILQMMILCLQHLNARGLCLNYLNPKPLNNLGTAP